MNQVSVKQCRRGAMIALGLGAALTLAGCAELSAWNRVKAENTPVAYDQFLAQFPASAHAGEAKTTRNQLLAQQKERAKNERESAQRRENVALNWAKLKTGMTVNEVETLIGPMKIKSAGTQQSFQNGKAGAATLKLGCDLYTLEFDENRRLTNWQRTQ